MKEAPSISRGLAASDFRTSRARVFRRQRAGETPATCDKCGTEVDVLTPAHDPTAVCGPKFAEAPVKIRKGPAAKMTRGGLDRKLTTEAVHKADGSFTAAEMERRFRASVPMTVLCGVAGCDWPGFTGPSDEAQELGIAHRLREHPELVSKSAAERKQRLKAQQAQAAKAARDEEAAVRAITGAAMPDPDLDDPDQPLPDVLPQPTREPTGPVQDRRGRRHRHQPYTREEIVEALREWATSHDGFAPLAHDWQQAGDTHPNAVTVDRMFGTWATAVTEAGLTPRQRQPRGPGIGSRPPKWPSDKIIEAILSFNEKYGRAPLSMDFRKGGEYPSETTVRLTFGSFNAGIEAAGLTPQPTGVTIRAQPQKIEAPQTPVPQEAPVELVEKHDGSRLIPFLYLLMRDLVPVGKLAKILQDFEEGDVDSFVFSDRLLEAKASQLAWQLLAGLEREHAQAVAIESLTDQPPAGISC